MNTHSWVRDGKSVQSFKKLIPLTLLKEIKGLCHKSKAEPLVRPAGRSGRTGTWGAGEALASAQVRYLSRVGQKTLLMAP